MRKVRVAVVGVGVHGRRHALKYSQSERAELVAVVDLDRELAAEVATQTGARALSAYSTLFGQVDAVSVVVSAHSHYAVARDCLAAGLDVLVEKPITLELADADHLVALAEQGQRILQVGHIERFNPAVRAVAMKVESPRYLSCSRIVPCTDRMVDVDVVRDLMIHDIDLACWLIGRPVIGVESSGAALISGTLDLVQARLRFEGGCVADLFASRVGEIPERKLKLLQRDNYTSIDLMNSSFVWPRQVEGAPAGQLIPGPLASDALAIELEGFLECVQTRSRPLVDGRTGRHALALAHAIREGVRPAARG